MGNKQTKEKILWFISDKFKYFAGIFCLIALSKRHPDSYVFAGGTIISVIIAKVSKKLIRAPRPQEKEKQNQPNNTTKMNTTKINDHSQKDEYHNISRRNKIKHTHGMPSSHSLVGFYMATMLWSASISVASGSDRDGGVASPSRLTHRPSGNGRGHVRNWSGGGHVYVCIGTSFRTYIVMMIF
eukprot:gb/GECH01009366.1/.p1 GENE.gb/GECH01009366.1/~~gb/GECH01009366.1/.p1  ORF type:complete len:184 (+),score=20.30 gb/GECH01009366.1/:1-552(+)